MSPALGAEVRGVDLRRPLRPEELAQLRAALTSHFLLRVPDQDLDDEQHAGAVAQFGALALEGLGQKHRVGFVSNTRPGGTLGSRAATFHIDYGFTDHPYEFLSLYGLEIPPDGTETWFANAVAAARDLPPDLLRRVEHLTARAAVDVTSEIGEAGIRLHLGRLDETYPHARRPVLWPHRDTGGPILAVWQQQTDAILPLAPDESNALLEALFAHLYRPDHIYVHHWEPCDLLIWDNHALQHARPDIGVDVPRTLRRVCVGTTPDLSIFAARSART